MKVNQFLTRRGIWFESIPHQPTYDAQRMAQALHVPGDLVAKTVLLRADHGYVITVLPATHHIDVESVQRLLDVDRVQLATELECGEKFPDWEFGAVPPFGSQYGMRTLLDQSLAEGESMVFEGNTHEESIRVRYQDFLQLEDPLVAMFSHHDP